MKGTFKGHEITCTFAIAFAAPSPTWRKISNSLPDDEGHVFAKVFCPPPYSSSNRPIIPVQRSKPRLIYSHISALFEPAPSRPMSSRCFRCYTSSLMLARISFHVSLYFASCFCRLATTALRLDSAGGFWTFDGMSAGLHSMCESSSSMDQSPGFCGPLLLSIQCSFFLSLDA